MQRTGKFLRFAFSMRAALILLLVLVLACVAGSVIPQGEIAAYYESAYPGRAGWCILLLGLDDVFHSAWFVVLTALLCANLLGCNLLRFPAIYRKMKSGYTPERCLAAWNGEVQAEVSGDPEALFRRMGFHRMEACRLADGREARYAVRNRIGAWGAWLTHLGMLIVIAGFALGQIFTVQYAVYGVPGQTKPVADTGYELTIDRFDVELREDETVDQYRSALTLTAPDGASRSGEASVNHPLRLFGMKLYQNSTGWAADALVWRGEELVQQNLLCAGEQLDIEGMDGLVLAFNAFYPDYVAGEDGMPATASTQLNNPAYLYTLYYQGRVLGMNALKAGERITVEDYSIAFNDPRQYTLIQLKRDPFTWLAGIGALVMIAALFVSFYLRTEELWAVRMDDSRWGFAGRSRKGGSLFADALKERAARLDEGR